MSCVAAAVAGAVAGCARSDEAASTTRAPSPVADAAATYGERFPDPVLGSCAEPLAAGAPDVSGLWVPRGAERAGQALPADDPLLNDLQRVEQCGGRVVVTAGGQVRDLDPATYRDGALVVPSIDGSDEETRRRDGEQLTWTRGDTTVTSSLFARYGTPNIRYIKGWTPATEHGPMWALNLMKYRDVADYRDGRPATISGAQADELYNPVAPLTAVGGRILLVAEVEAQVVGDDVEWDRVAVAQYPTRPAFLALQDAPGFQELHQHKEAGVAFTIVSATFPQEGAAPPDAVTSAVGSDQKLLLEVVADPDAPDLAAGLTGAVPIGAFDVEDVLIGDQRSWAEARWHLISSAAADELAARGRTTATDRYAVILDPRLDLLAQSIRDDRAGTYPAPAP